MTRTVAAVALTLALAAPGAATAAPGPAEDPLTCSFGLLAHRGEGRWLALLGGADVVFNDGTDLRTGRAMCAVREGERHTDPLLASVTSLTTPGVAHVPDSVVEFVLGPLSDFTICLTAEVDGAGRFYWDGIAEEWSSSPLVLCHDFGPRNEFEDVFEAICLVTGDEDVYVADDEVWSCPIEGEAP